MRYERRIVKRQELALRAVRALDAGLSAHAALPLVAARG